MTEHYTTITLILQGREGGRLSIMLLLDSIYSTICLRVEDWALRYCYTCTTIWEGKTEHFATVTLQSVWGGKTEHYTTVTLQGREGRRLSIVLLLYLYYNLSERGRLSITLLLHYKEGRGEDWVWCYYYTYTTICLRGEDWALCYCYTRKRVGKIEHYAVTWLHLLYNLRGEDWALCCYYTRICLRGEKIEHYATVTLIL